MRLFRCSVLIAIVWCIRVECECVWYMPMLDITQSKCSSQLLGCGIFPRLLTMWYWCGWNGFCCCFFVRKNWNFSRQSIQKDDYHHHRGERERENKVTTTEQHHQQEQREASEESKASAMLVLYFFCTQSRTAYTIGNVCFSSCKTYHARNMHYACAFFHTRTHITYFHLNTLGFFSLSTTFFHIQFSYSIN